MNESESFFHTAANEMAVKQQLNGNACAFDNRFADQYVRVNFDVVFPVHSDTFKLFDIVTTYSIRYVESLHHWESRAH